MEFLRGGGSRRRGHGRERPSPDFLLASIYSIAHLIYFSTLGGLVSPLVDRVALAVVALAVATAIGMAIARRHYLAAFSAIAVLALIALQVLVFAHHLGTQPNWNVALPYVPMAGFILFVNARHELGGLLRLLVGLAIVYCAIYAVFADMFASLGQTAGLHMLSDESRGERLVLANGYASLALFAALVRLRFDLRDWRWLAVLAIVVLALVQAQSRVYALLAVGTAALYLLDLLRPPIRLVIGAVFAAVIMAILFGAAILDWNPFALVDWDSSGAARAMSYAALQPLLSAHPLTGLGLPSGPDGLGALVGRSYVFWEDLGAFGVWTAFGALGAAIFLALALGLVVGPLPDGSFEEEALGLALFTAALFAVVSPSLLSGSASILANFVPTLYFVRPWHLRVQQ